MMLEIEHSKIVVFYERLADRWSLTNKERWTLLDIDQATHEKWKADSREVRLSREQIIRISKLINVFDGLHRIFDDGKFADAWIRRDNGAFGGKPPLSVLLSGSPTDFQEVFELVMSVANL